MEHVEPTVQMAEPVRVPEEYRDTIIQFVQALWHHYAWHMREQFGFHSLPPAVDAGRAMLTDTLAEIARVAIGEITDEDDLAIVYEGVQGLMELLFAPPGLGSAYTIPAGFWDTPLGQMVALAMLRIRGDDLITMAEAAEIKEMTVAGISRAIDDGRLRAYHDPAAPARQGRRKVSLREVEAL
jgi:hypothetical protein